ncbi:hypothetical protein BU14_0300s0006 [Porphyra umbilicalis]|uniref:Uncharacterized protein n=1 Tax=Porphyra umbilicalis TaxID=2786 RepID=A0A1X6P016_PORUM|nr:hypothetical protein BU14_0300s0006 [Porphyra umbilicalis]|eukprot:OSX74209.1 hypothetical protein BU14_0300s0006 [Porphyra umbilicalis]
MASRVSAAHGARCRAAASPTRGSSPAIDTRRRSASKKTGLHHREPPPHARGCSNAAALGTPTPTTAQHTPFPAHVPSATPPSEEGWGSREPPGRPPREPRRDRTSVRTLGATAPLAASAPPTAAPCQTRRYCRVALRQTCCRRGRRAAPRPLQPPAGAAASGGGAGGDGRRRWHKPSRHAGTLAWADPSTRRKSTDEGGGGGSKTISEPGRCAYHHHHHRRFRRRCRHRCHRHPALSTFPAT